MTIDRWGSMAASSSPRSQVAPRTPCAPCTARGHHCDAFDIVGGRAVCIHCLDGVDCPRTPRNGVVDAPKPKAPMVNVTQAKAFSRAMSSEDREKQRRSFAHGNVSLHNPEVTRVVIDEAAEALPLPQASSASIGSPRRVFLRHAGCNVGPAKTRGKYKGEERARAKEMLASGMSLSATVAATGLSRNTVSSVRKELPGLPRAGKGGVPRKAADLSAAAAEQVVVEAEAITAQVADEIARRSVSRTEGELAAKSDEVFSKLKEEHAVFPVAPKADELAKNRWTRAPEVMDLADVPGGRVSAYDGAVAKLRAAPVGKVTWLSYATVALAETYRDGIAKRAHRAGLKMSSRLVGSDLYIWLREKA